MLQAGGGKYHTQALSCSAAAGGAWLTPFAVTEARGTGSVHFFLDEWTDLADWMVCSLGEVLKAYSKEVIRQQPVDIFEFSAQYFAQLDQQEEEFMDSNACASPQLPLPPHLNARYHFPSTLRGCCDGCPMPPSPFITVQPVMVYCSDVNMLALGCTGQVERDHVFKLVYEVCDSGPLLSLHLFPPSSRIPRSSL